ncbi:MAG: PhnD/SsuA/transferrin family substrate-binding protein [Pseudomonadota bacterium]
MRVYARFIVALLFLLTTATYAADDEIIFSTAPTHSKEETLKLYTPLMNYLTKVTGKKFVIKPAANFIEYSVRMRLDKYDMLFDGPHLTGWRMVNMDHTPIVRFPGTIRIVVAADKESSLNSLKDLEGGYARVCAFASPNMLTMAFLSYYPNPVQQPRLIRTQGFKELVSCLKSNRGQAAVLRDKLWGKIKDEDKAEMKLIASPKRGYPERTFSVSPRVSEPLRKQIAEAMLSEEGLKASKALRTRFKKKSLLAAKPVDYKGLDQLLNPVWGFHSR